MNEMNNETYQGLITLRNDLLRQRAAMKEALEKAEEKLSVRYPHKDGYCFCAGCETLRILRKALAPLRQVKTAKGDNDE